MLRRSPCGPCSPLLRRAGHTRGPQPRLRYRLNSSRPIASAPTAADRRRRIARAVQVYQHRRSRWHGRAVPRPAQRRPPGHRAPGRSFSHGAPQRSPRHALRFLRCGSQRFDGLPCASPAEAAPAPRGSLGRPSRLPVLEDSPSRANDAPLRLNSQHCPSAVPILSGLSGDGFARKTVLRRAFCLEPLHRFLQLRR